VGNPLVPGHELFPGFLPPPLPGVGESVHYVARGSADGVYPMVCRAAIVTQVTDASAVPGTAYDEVDPETLGLAVLNPTGLFFHERVKHVEEEMAGGCWHYLDGWLHQPENVER